MSDANSGWKRAVVDGLLRRPVSRFARSLCAQRDRPVGLVVTSAFVTKRSRDQPPRRRLFRRPCNRPVLRDLHGESSPIVEIGAARAGDGSR